MLLLLLVEEALEGLTVRVLHRRLALVLNPSRLLIGNTHEGVLVTVARRFKRMSVRVCARACVFVSVCLSVYLIGYAPVCLRLSGYTVTYTGKQTDRHTHGGWEVR